jgi:UDP-glucose 4-epimerase
MGEMALKAYHKQFGLKGVSCRLFTVYGPRENETHAIIALLAKAYLKQDPYEVWGTGRQDRNFTYVSDAVTGLLLATEQIEDCRSINIGTNEIITLSDAAKIICEISDHRPERIFFDISKPEGVHARSAAIHNQELWLGWRPKILFDEGIRLTHQWYSLHFDLNDLKKNLEKKLFER